MIITIPGHDLWSVLRSNLTTLAHDTALGLESSALTSIQCTRLLVTEQSMQDCDSYVSCNTSYNMYTSITMRGGLVDDRHKPVHTVPVFISCGSAPYLQFSDRSAHSYSTAHLASNMVNTVKTGLARWWSGHTDDETAVKTDPEIQLTVQHSVKDESRTGV